MNKRIEPDPAEDDDETDDSESESEPESDEDDIAGALTENQRRVLYLISLYTSSSAEPGEKEEWIRKQAMTVLIFEGIVRTILDYDYSPSSSKVEGHQLYLNISHEGLSDVDYLCEESLLRILKLASNLHVPITCYQISDKGQQVVDRLSKIDKSPVNELVFAPGTRNLLHLIWEDEKFIMRDDETGYSQESGILEVEDVSYVSSAYIPLCLRQGGRPTLSNAHRAHESGVAAGNVKDVLDEVITLNSVSMIVSEFMPFGANNMVTANTNLGSAERVQGGLFTAAIQEDKVGTKLYIDPGLTRVDILDYSLSNHVNFEADIQTPEEPGIVQVECFGMSLNASGACFYGMQLEAVQERIRDGISLDQMSRVLVDVQMDSSTIVDSVVSRHQRELLQLIFRGDAANRAKVKLIVANEIVPHLMAEEYMDKGEYENELKQVVGDTKTAFDISEHDVLIFGDEGLMLVGPNSRHHEPLLCSYLEVINVDLFTRTYYQRLFYELDAMEKIKSKIFDAESDPNSIPTTHTWMAQCSRNLIMMGEILGYMREALEAIVIPPEPPEATGRALYSRLNVPTIKRELDTRVKDLEKIMSGAWEEFNILKEVTDNKEDEKNYHISELIESNSRQLIERAEDQAKASATLDTLVIIFTAMFAFALLDRFCGDWSVVNPAVEDANKGRMDMQDFVEKPFAWLAISLVAIVVLGACTTAWLGRAAFLRKGTIIVRIKVNERINLDNLQAFLASKHLEDEDHRLESSNHIIKVVYTERSANDWGGFTPSIMIEFDDTTAFMLYVEMRYNYRRAKRFLAFNSEELKQQLFDEMHRSEVFLNGNYMPASLPASVKGTTAQAVAVASAGEMITKEKIKD